MLRSQLAQSDSTCAEASRTARPTAPLVAPARYLRCRLPCFQPRSSVARQRPSLVWWTAPSPLVRHRFAMVRSSLDWSAIEHVKPWRFRGAGTRSCGRRPQARVDKHRCARTRAGRRASASTLALESSPAAARSCSSARPIARLVTVHSRQRHVTDLGGRALCEAGPCVGVYEGGSHRSSSGAGSARGLLCGRAGIACRYGLT